jgi:DNA-3-methyladenine glycosylase
MGKKYTLSGTIIETEAYGHTNDPASHAFKRKTNRNKAMFGDVGRTYIYYIYGNHYCFNIVAKDSSCDAGAILIRAIQPFEGVNLMKIFRKTNNIRNLASGPGKLTQAFKISKRHNEIDITDNRNDFLYIQEEEEEDLYQKKKRTNKFKVLETSRIGITNGLDKKWRFVMLKSKENKEENSGDEVNHNSFISELVNY